LRFTQVSEILIVRTSALGDILHGMPLAAALKEKYPSCRITWVVDERYQELLSGHPCVDRILLVRFKEGMRTLWNGQGRSRWLGLVRMLRRLPFDVAIDPQGLFRSGCIAYLSGAPIRIGFPKGHVRETLNRLFTNVRPGTVPPRSHVIDRNLALLHPLGIQTRERRFSFRVPGQIEEEIHQYLAANDADREGLRVIVHPAAGWITKQWSPRRFAEIADRILQTWKARIFLLWGPGERQLAQQVQRYMRRAAHLVPDMGLSALVAFLRGCDLFIGGDSGPLHLASALGLPVLGLYGPSDPIRNGPFQGSYRIVTASAPCSPCYRRACGTTSCMDGISVDQVWTSLADLATQLRVGPTKGNPVAARGMA
jgi:lipopolysaccharide heptosyltransferase I